MKCRTPNLCLTVVSLPCCCRRELNAHTLIFRTHYMCFWMCVCLLWNQLNIKSQKYIYPVVPHLVYANRAVDLVPEGRDPGAGRLTWMDTDHFWVCRVSWFDSPELIQGRWLGRARRSFGLRCPLSPGKVLVPWAAQAASATGTCLALSLPENSQATVELTGF